MKIANVVLDGSKNYGPKLCAWLQNRRPDIVTLQKIGSNFPTIEDYECKCIDSPDPYLGVAVLGHRELGKKLEVGVCDLPDAEEGSRFLTARFLTVNIGDLWVSSVYAPYGPKSWGRRAITQRVKWLNHLRNHVCDKGYVGRDSVLCGDFNVKTKSDGPPKGELYSENEQDALEELLGCGFVDVYRTMYPDHTIRPGCTRGYSETRREGESRLHLILASNSLMQRMQSVCVDVDSRPWPRKDAPPLVAEFDNVGV